MLPHGLLHHVFFYGEYVCVLGNWVIAFIVTANNLYLHNNVRTLIIYRKSCNDIIQNKIIKGNFKIYLEELETPWVTGNSNGKLE